MSDSFSETTSTSWFQRIKNSFGGIIAGFLLVIAAIVGLFWNEGRAVNTARSLNEGAGLVMSIDPAQINPDANGKLVHFSGKLAATDLIKDTLFAGIEAPLGAVRLVRKVEMYQWQQSSDTKTKKKIGGSEEKTTVYSYAKTWSENAIDSSSFKKPQEHENPPMPAKSEEFGIKNGKVGAIGLAGKDFNNLGEEAILVPVKDKARIIKRQFSDARPVRVNGDSYLVSYNANKPRVGDVRITFKSARVETLSVVGKLQDNKINAYKTTNGGSISMFRTGISSATEMFDGAISGNNMLTWMFRIAGFLGLIAGFKIIFSIIGVIGDVVPIIGDVVRYATGFAAIALSAIIGTLVIGFAWIYFRPVLGMIIIGVGLTIGIAAIVIGKSKAKRSVAAA